MTVPVLITGKIAAAPGMSRYKHPTCCAGSLSLHTTAVHVCYVGRWYARLGDCMLSINKNATQSAALQACCDHSAWLQIKMFIAPGNDFAPLPRTGGMACYTGWLLSVCMAQGKGSIRTYPQIGYAAFGNAGRLLVCVLLYLELFCCCVDFIILEADNLSAVFPHAIVGVLGWTLSAKQVNAVAVWVLSCADCLFVYTFAGCTLWLVQHMYLHHLLLAYCVESHCPIFCNGWPAAPPKGCAANMACSVLPWYYSTPERFLLTCMLLKDLSLLPRALSQTMLLASAIVVLPTVWLRDMSLLSYISVGGIFASGALIGLVGWEGAAEVGFKHTAVPLVDWSGVPLALVSSCHVTAPCTLSCLMLVMRGIPGYSNCLVSAVAATSPWADVLLLRTMQSHAWHVFDMLGRAPQRLQLLLAPRSMICTLLRPPTAASRCRGCTASASVVSCMMHRCSVRHVSISLPVATTYMHSLLSTAASPADFWNLPVCFLHCSCSLFSPCRSRCFPISLFVHEKQGTVSMALGVCILPGGYHVWHNGCARVSALGHDRTHL